MREPASSVEITVRKELLTVQKQVKKLKPKVCRPGKTIYGSAVLCTKKLERLDSRSERTVEHTGNLSWCH